MFPVDISMEKHEYQNKYFFLFLHENMLWPLQDTSNEYPNMREDLIVLGFKDMSKKGVREKSKECHNHKLQPYPDTKRKRKPTNPNKHKSNRCTKSTKISSLFPKRGNRNAKRTEKHKNKMTQGKT